MNIAIRVPTSQIRDFTLLLTSMVGNGKVEAAVTKALIS